MLERHTRVVSLIQEIAATFIRNEANSTPLITITNTTTSKDFRRVTIYITTIPDGGEEDACIFLKRKASDLKHFIKKNSNLKIIPHLDFEIDRGERHRQHIDELSDKIKSEEESK